MQVENPPCEYRQRRLYVYEWMSVVCARAESVVYFLNQKKAHKVFAVKKLRIPFAIWNEKWKVNRMLLVCSSLIISLSRQNENSAFNEKWRNLILPEAMKITNLHGEKLPQQIICCCCFFFSLDFIYIYIFLSKVNEKWECNHKPWLLDVCFFKRTEEMWWKVNFELH